MSVVYYDVQRLSDYLVYQAKNEGEKLLNAITLQFCLYRIQTEFIRHYGRKCFKELFIAEQIGPICYESYQNFFGHGSDRICWICKDFDKKELAFFNKEPIFQRVLAQRKEYYFEYFNWFRYPNSAYEETRSKRNKNDDHPSIFLSETQEFKNKIKFI